jgi:hypothetical protein
MENTDMSHKHEQSIQQALDVAFKSFEDSLSQQGFSLEDAGFNTSNSPVSVTPESWERELSRFREVCAARLRWPLWLKLGE